MHVWKGRFTQDMNEIVCRFTQSLDLDWRTANADIRGSIAHVRMLVSTGLLPQSEGKLIEENLEAIREEITAGTFIPSEALEDVHMNIESRLIERIGATGARLHMGRSRNDQSNTSVRLTLRVEILALWDQLNQLLSVLLKKAEEHAEIIVPGYTHLQQAQPISMGHFWMAHFQAFSRDAERLMAAYDSTDECPLGCAALAGTTLPLDREQTARDLGFARIAPNSMDAIAHRDHLLDFHHFASVFGTHVSRLAEDLIIYFSTEFGWIQLPDAFCTGSSIMPQKKNPDVLEILRGKSGQLIGALVDTLTMVKGIPLTFNRDLQEDKRALWRSVDALHGMLEVLPPLLDQVSVNETAAARGFQDGLILATDVAEYLVQKNIPFRTAHEKVGHCVRWCVENNRPMTSLTLNEWKEIVPEAEADLLPLLSPKIAVERRQTLGGTAPSQVRIQITQGEGKRRLLEEKATAYRAKLPDGV